MAVKGKVISRTKTLHEAGISETSNFEFKDRRTRISIFLRNTVSSHRIQADFYPFDTILIVKEHIKECENIPVEQQRIIFGNRQLNDDITLLKCGIKNHDELIFILRFC